MKDKEWLKDSLAKEMYNAEIQGIFSSSGMSNLLYDDIVKLIDQLDEPEITDPTISKKETVEVPQFVANHIEYNKERKWNIRDVFYDVITDEHLNGDIDKWIENNPEKFSRAWLDGYTIEPPKTLQVIIKNYDSTVYTTDIPEDEAMKLIEGLKGNE